MDKNHDNEKNFDTLAETPAFYALMGVCLLAIILCVVLVCVAGGKKYETVEETTIKNINAGNYSQPEEGDLADSFQGYKNFKSHDDYVLLGESLRPTQTPESTTATPEETAKNTEIPTETPNQTIAPTQDNGKITYNLSAKYSNETNTVVGGLTESIKVGNVLIDNSYGAEGFDLLEVLSEDLVITKSDRLDWPRIILFSTFAGQGYATTEEDKKISIITDGYNTAYSITERAKVLEKYAENLGVGVARTADICDTVTENAYTQSSNVAKNLARICTTCELSIDLQRGKFEYPEGTKYSPTVTKDGKKYAQVRFIVSQNDETNPNWRENIKFITLLIEKLSEKVPGISLGIELRPDGKFNTQATKFGLLIELGYEGNLTGEADNTAAVLGETIAEIYLGK